MRTTLYHGTTAAAASAILAEGLAGPSYWGTEDVARPYSDGVLIAVDADRIADLLVPNLMLIDSLRLQDPDDEGIAEWDASAQTWQDSLAIFGSVTCEATVEILGDDFVTAPASGPR